MIFRISNNVVYARNHILRRLIPNPAYTIYRFFKYIQLKYKIMYLYFKEFALHEAIIRIRRGFHPSVIQTIIVFLSRTTLDVGSACPPSFE